eukprot:COSAG02_NODE_1683_length_11339_cov_976.310409_10_plen_74_part_00
MNKRILVQNSCYALENSRPNLSHYCLILPASNTPQKKHGVKTKLDADTQIRSYDLGSAKQCATMIGTRMWISL